MATAEVKVTPALFPSAPPECEPADKKNSASQGGSKQQEKWLKRIPRCKRREIDERQTALFINSPVEAVLSRRRRHHHQHSLSSDTQFPKLPPHSSTFLPCSPVPSLFHSVCLLWDVKELLARSLFACAGED